MAHAHLRSHSGPALKTQFLDHVYRRGLNPVVLKLAGRRWSPWAIVRHVGRRSGRTYATPVVAPRVMDDSVRIVVAFGVHTDWCRNLLAAGRYGLRWQGQDYALVDPTLTETAGAWRLLRRSRYLTARKVKLDDPRER